MPTVVPKSPTPRMAMPTAMQWANSGGGIIAACSQDGGAMTAVQAVAGEASPSMAIPFGAALPPPPRPPPTAAARVESRPPLLPLGVLPRTRSATGGSCPEPPRAPLSWPPVGWPPAISAALAELGVDDESSAALATLARVAAGASQSDA